MADSFVLDRATILGRLGGDEEIFSMMLGMYLQDVENNCAGLAVALASGDVEAVQREAHTVKGLLATVSDDSGAAAAFAVELQARQGELAGLDASIAGLQRRLREVAAVLKVELASAG